LRYFCSRACSSPFVFFGRNNFRTYMLSFQLRSLIPELSVKNQFFCFGIFRRGFSAFSTYTLKKLTEEGNESL
jgi:hypothetical protein